MRAHDTRSMRDWISSIEKFKHLKELDQAGYMYRQQDAQEFLTALTEQCENLKRLTFFQKRITKTCTNCSKTSDEGLENCHELMLTIFESNNNIKSLHERNCLSSRDQTCELCSPTSDVPHQILESFESVPNIMIVMLRRFVPVGNKFIKNQNCVTPSEKITECLTLKAVSEHEGASKDEGHYTTSLRKNDANWIKISDTTLTPTNTIPRDGYILLYEKIDKGTSDLGLQVNNSTTNFHNQPNQQKKRARCQSPKSPILIPPKTSTSPSINQNIKGTRKSDNFTRKYSTNLVDVSLDFSKVSRNEMIERLIQKNCKVNPKRQNEQNIEMSLRRITEKDHPIHEDLLDKELFSNAIIKELVTNLNIKFISNYQRMRNYISRYFFENCPKAPLTGLVNYMNGEIFEIPDLNANSKENSPAKIYKWKKRKRSCTDEVPPKKVPKFDPKSVEINQERLKDCRSKMLKDLQNGEEYSSIFINNPIIEAGKEFQKIMTEWNREEKCKICKEEWFDQGNNSEGICKRCASEKATANKSKDSSENEYIHVFSDENDMIPSPVPEVLTCLNGIERAAIAIISPNLNVYYRRGGTPGFTGHSISFEQNVQEL